jgi:hypothetical protein
MSIEPLEGLYYYYTSNRTFLHGVDVMNSWVNERWLIDIGYARERSGISASPFNTNNPSNFYPI